MRKLQCKQVIQGLPPILDTESVCSLDLELSGLREGQLHRPSGHMVSLAASFDGESAYIIFDEQEVPEFLNRIKKATWIFHNSTFDIAHLRRWATIPERKNMRDTLLIERILWSNFYEDFDLKALVRRYLKCYMQKDVRKEFIDHVGPMTPEQLEYAALDVIGTWLVDKEQQKHVGTVDRKIWDNLYNPHVWTTLELGGFKLDVDMWRDLAEKNQLIVDTIEEKLGKKYGIYIDKVKHSKRLPATPKDKFVYDEDTGEVVETIHPSDERFAEYEARMEEYRKATETIKEFVPFNPSSSAQVLKILQSRGLKVESTGDDIIRPYYETDDFVKDILDYRKAEKQVSTYGLKFLKNVEEDGRIYTSLNIGLAESGRDSSSSPNLQNIPKDKERRACFIAGEGKKLVLYDYSGQEAGTWAYITGDEKFKEIINSGKKLYIEVARIVFNEEIKKGTHRYDIIKALVLGLMYGLTPWGFARNNDVDIEVAEQMFDAFMRGFPTSARWIKEQQSTNRGVAYTIIGRYAHLHPYNRQWKNNALNTPNQGSGGDMIKLAMKKLRQTDFYKKYYPEGRVCILLQVHDEILTEVDENLSVEWAEIQKKTMIDVAESLTPGIMGGVSGGIISSWAEKD